MEVKVKTDSDNEEGSLPVYTKDADMVKLFVGQVPRGWEESELREVMEPFGPIHELSILKDRTDGASKGDHCRISPVLLD